MRAVPITRLASIAVRCPSCYGEGLRLVEEPDGTPARIYCPRCGWAEEAKGYLEVRGVYAFRLIRIQRPVVVRQEAFLNGRRMRYALVFTSLGTLVLAVKRIPWLLLAPSVCLEGCEGCSLRPRPRENPLRERWYCHLPEGDVSGRRLGSELVVVLGWPEVLLAENFYELMRHIVGVVCSVDYPTGLPGWLFKVLGIAPRCPECRSFRVKPTGRVRGEYRCDSCGAVFIWQGRRAH